MPDTSENSGPQHEAAIAAPVLHEALDRLVEIGILTLDQAEAVRHEVAADVGPQSTVPGAQASSRPHGASWTSVLAEVGGYVGGAFVLGAAAVFLSNNWDTLSLVVQLAVLGVPAALLLAAAVSVAVATPGGWQRGSLAAPLGGRAGAVAARRRVVSVFVTVAAFLAAWAAGTCVNAQSADGTSDWTVAVGFWTGLLVAGGGYVLCRGELLHVAIGSAAFGATLTTVHAIGTYTGSRVGETLIVLGLVWALATLSGALSEREVGLGWSGLVIFIGGETLALESTGHTIVGYVVLVALAVSGLVGFTLLRSIMLLAVGVITLAVVVPQIVIDVTDGALGASGALLVIGLSIVGASVLGLRLRRATDDDEQDTQHVVRV